MCGICGVLPAGPITPQDREIVARMSGALEHRGPDGDGLWVSETAALGHRRLAIIDLQGGQQPLFNEDRTVAVVFNGEIYNYRELRTELQGLGHRFATQSDTEVLVHGWEQWQEGLVPRLRGMFAFGLRDERRQTLVLVRDRLGVKSLYWYRCPRTGRLTFASEIKALFADPGVPRALNESRLPEYLAFRSVAGNETLFEQIQELEPGTLLRIDAQLEPSAQTYWSVEHGPNAAGGDPVERGAALLRDAVACRLVSDVPLGTITSGGLDSSLVSAIAAELTPGPIDTFCVGFDDARFDERPYARAVAGALGSRHHEVVAGPADIERELEPLTWAHDEPLTHPNSIPMHLIFRYAKDEAGVTVLLSGEGADEVFGGYEWYQTAMQRQRLHKLGPLRRVLAAAPHRRVRTLGRVLAPDYLVWANAVSRHAAENLLGSTDGQVVGRRARLWPGARPGVDGLFLYDQRSYLLPLLQRQDRMSMAAGLEARVPFLDHALVEWANSLSAAQKIPGGHRKLLLKRIAERWLASATISRRKVGFAMPLGAWLRPGGPLAQLLDPIRDQSAAVRRFVNAGEIERLIRENSQGTADHSDLLWTLLSLEKWFGIFLGSEAVRPYRLSGACRGTRPLALDAAP